MTVSSADLLAAVRPALAALAEDLLERAKDTQVNAGLRAVWRHEKDAQRTADTFEVWARERVKQIAAAWVLSLVFVRTLEDRNLIDRRRIAGDGADDSEELFFRLAPHLTQRDYLQTVFRELEHLEGARHIFGPRHNPVWLLGPSGEAAARLLEAFRATDEAGSIRLDFSGPDTRFLGDLYQDLDDESRVRYALLQTPEFVEEFILDETLDPAIRQYKVENVKMIDPACGSGHFLLGAYRRLLAAWREKEPAADPREVARRALGQVHGVDLNPYAVAIARFRMTLSYLDASGYLSLKGVPPLPLKIAVADSLIKQQRFAAFDHATGDDDAFNLEDTKLAADILHEQTYHVVVGNPPYIAPRDAALRELYRRAYRSCHGKYQLVAPFLERFFQLALNPRVAGNGGYVGAIVGNGFMKREFGKKFVEEVLPEQQLTHLVDTSGAYIPGHGTPTVILFGRRWGNPERPPQTAVIAVMGKRGEPTSPDDPAQAEVWSSIRDHHREIGYEDEYISVAEVERTRLSSHPWTLQGGGASQLKAKLDQRSQKTLADFVKSIGPASFIGLDDVFIMPLRVIAGSARLPRELLRPIVIGESVRDWSVECEETALAPYSATGLPIDVSPADGWLRHLWPFRTTINAVVDFGGRTRGEAGEQFWHWYRWIPDRYRTPLSITFAFVSTHNHFVLDRGGKVFNRSAPVIKLPEDATEDDHLALLGYLNSSTACFWMKQVFYPKASAIGDISVEKGKEEDNRYEFAGTGMLALPLPDEVSLQRLVSMARELDQLARERSECDPRTIIDGSWSTKADLMASFESARLREQQILERMVALQEHLDWMVYEMMGLTNVAAGQLPQALVRPEARPFMWDADEAPAELPGELRALYSMRRLETARNKNIQLIETPVFKRPWAGQRGVFGHKVADFDDKIVQACASWLLDRIEGSLRNCGTKPVSVRTVAASLRGQSPAMTVAEVLTSDSSPNLENVCADLIREESVPFLAAWRCTDSGLEKRAAWETTWDLQRREDAGEAVEVPVPPKYSQSDYRSGIAWRHRGKLDVPKERFICYSGAETEDDSSPVIGWAGWDHLEQARALAELYNHRKREEAWSLEKLVPLLAGLQELVPWLKQWHNEPDPKFGGARVGDTYEAFVAAEAASFSLSLDDLRAWRPRSEAPGRRRGASSRQPGSRRARTHAIDRDQLLVLISELDEGDGAEQRALAERLGVSGAAVARVADALVRGGLLEVTGSRPKRFRQSAPGASGESA